MVDVVGAGPAGCTVAIYLARNGFDVTLYEGEPIKEKPCGGGLSWRVLREYKEFLEDVPSFPIDSAELDFEGKEFSLNFNKCAGYVINRSDFNRHMRKMVSDEGVKIINKTVDMSKQKGLTIDATGNEKSPRMGVALRCYAKMNTEKMKFVFRREFVKLGYFWIFPMGNGIVNVGVGGLANSFKVSAKESLEWFLNRNRLATNEISGAAINLSGRIEKLVNGNIIKVGEAAGLVNPATGEGIYHAMKSGELAAKYISKDNVKEYEKEIQKMFSGEFRKSNILIKTLSFLPVPASKLVFGYGMNKVKEIVNRGL